MKYLILFLYYVAYIICQDAGKDAADAPEAGGKEGEETKEGEGEEKDKGADKDKVGSTIICDNKCLQNSGYLADEERCAMAEEQQPAPQACIMPEESQKAEKPEEKKEEEGGKEGEEGGEEAAGEKLRAVGRSKLM